MCSFINHLKYKNTLKHIDSAVCKMKTFNWLYFLWALLPAGTLSLITIINEVSNVKCVFCIVQQIILCSN